MKSIVYSTLYLNLITLFNFVEIKSFDFVEYLYNNSYCDLYIYFNCVEIKNRLSYSFDLFNLLNSNSNRSKYWTSWMKKFHAVKFNLNEEISHSEIQLKGIKWMKITKIPMKRFIMKNWRQDLIAIAINYISGKRDLNPQP